VVDPSTQPRVRSLKIRWSDHLTDGLSDGLTVTLTENLTVRTSEDLTVRPSDDPRDCLTICGLWWSTSWKVRNLTLEFQVTGGQLPSFMSEKCLKKEPKNY